MSKEPEKAPRQRNRTDSAVPGPRLFACGLHFLLPNKPLKPLSMLPAASWLPGTWFVLMMPFLQNPIFYLVGFASSALAFANLTKVRKLPAPTPVVEASLAEAPQAAA